MLATENSPRKLLTILALAMLAAITGCTPSGPRSLLRGDELLRDGKPAQAIEALTVATRLMPDEPRAWNLLGLAYHRAGQPSLAKQAYQQALARDRSNRVAIAHYNLGCLLLEQNSPSAAAEQLRSFTLTRNSEAGLVKLATAQLRLRQVDAAERSFAAALRLNAKNPEALNGIGVIHAQRNQRDAAQFFNSALEANPKYAPALLNSGLLAQQNPATRSNALHRFQEYLAASPGSAPAEPVKLLVRQLELDLSPRPATPPNVIANASLKTNALLAVLQSSNAIPPTSAPPRLTLIGTNAKPQLASAKTNVSNPVTETGQVARSTNAPPAAPTNVPVTVILVSNPVPPKVVAAEPSLVAQAPKPPPQVAISPPPAEPVIGFPPPEEKKETQKPGLLARLNPFRTKSKVETNDVPRVVVLNQPANGTTAAEQRTFSRYAYLSPAPPRPGNRANAERAMASALKAQRAGETNVALREFQRAASEDPGYFEAQYNAALFALQIGDLERALAGCETALAIQPDSINARYNFALALKQANYPIDSVSELEKIVEGKPNDARAHLVLGNLYAQQLNEPKKARFHYQKLLELEPRNAQASAIRFWLAANP